MTPPKDGFACPDCRGPVRPGRAARLHRVLVVRRLPALQPVRVDAVAGSVWTMTSASSGQRARTASSMSPARRWALGSG